MRSEKVKWPFCHFYYKAMDSSHHVGSIGFEWKILFKKKILINSLELFIKLFVVAIIISISSIKSFVKKNKRRKYVNKFILSFQFALM